MVKKFYWDDHAPSHDTRNSGRDWRGIEENIQRKALEGENSGGGKKAPPPIGRALNNFLEGERGRAVKVFKSTGKSYLKPLDENKRKHFEPVRSGVLVIYK